MSVSSRTYKILVAEDDPITRMMLVRNMRSDGYEIFEAENGVQAVELFVEHHPDLILMDEMMPELNGIGACTEIKAIAGASMPPVLLVTAVDQREVIEKAFAVGVTDYITKPVNMFLLGHRIRQLLKSNDYKQALQASEERYRIISESISDYAYSFRVYPDGQVDCDWITEAFTRLTGHSAENLTHLDTWKTIFHNGDDGNERWERILAGEKDVRELRFLTHDGRTRWVTDHVTPVWDEQAGRVVRIYGAARDITERKRAEAEVQRYVQRLETLHQIDDIFSRPQSIDEVLDMALEATMNISGATIGGIGIIEGQNMRLTLHTPRQDPPRRQQNYPLPMIGIMGRVNREGRPEYVRDISDDEDYHELDPHTCSEIAIPLMTQQDDKQVGVLSLETDNPDTFNEELFEFIQLIGRRIATALETAMLYSTLNTQIADLEAYGHTIAHDLKSPLNIILGNAELLLEDPDESISPLTVQMLEKIFETSGKAIHMVEQMLWLAKVRNAQEVVVPINLNAVAQAAIERYQTEIEQNSVQIQFDHELPDALGHDVWVEEVFANLVHNALKYMGEDNPRPTIRISGMTDGQRARYEVRDNGIGIKQEDRERLFKMFSRIETGKVKGFGLGLSIVHRIVTKLGGEVGVSSQPGEGSTFWFTLPLVTDAAIRPVNSEG